MSKVSKVNRAKSPLFLPLESLKTRLYKFSNGLNKFSNGSTRASILEVFENRGLRIEDRESRIENRGSRIEFRGTVNLPLSGTVTRFNNIQNFPNCLPHYFCLFSFSPSLTATSLGAFISEFPKICCETSRFINKMK